MSGNVYEWCWDRYGSYHGSSQTDPTGVSSGLARIFRGGCWHSHGSYCRVANRGGSSATTVNSGFGFRLSRAIP